MRFNKAAIVLTLAFAAGCATQRAQPPAPAAVPQPAPAPVENKGDPNARFAEALQLMKDGKLQDAEAAFFALNKDFPQYSGPPTDLGIIYGKTGRRDLAIGALSRAEQVNPGNAVALNLLGLQYRLTGQYARAEDAWRRALAVKPDYAAAHFNLGILYDQYLHRPADALAEYRAYQRLTDGKDLRVLVWAAELERQVKDQSGHVTMESGQ